MAKVVRTAVCDGCGETRKCTYYGRESIDLCSDCDESEPTILEAPEDESRAVRMHSFLDLSNDEAEF